MCESKRNGRLVRVWSYEASLKLINIVTTAKLDIASRSSYNLNNPSYNAKKFWRNMKILLENEGVYANEAEIHKKWNNLVRSYRVCSRYNGSNSRRFRFYEEMSDFFNAFNHVPQDYNSDHNNDRTHNKLPNVRKTEIISANNESDDDIEQNNDNNYKIQFEIYDDANDPQANTDNHEEENSFCERPVAGADYNNSNKRTRYSENTRYNKIYTAYSNNKHTAVSPIKVAKLQNVTEKQFDQYLRIKQKEYDNRQMRHREKMKLKREELEIQRQKLEFLRKLAVGGSAGVEVLDNTSNSVNEVGNVEEVYLMASE